jgi:hypothetical protein
MRRRLAALALSVAAFAALGACADSSKNQDPSGGTGGSTATPGTTAPTAAPTVLPGVPGGADIKTVCAGYTKVEGEAGAKFLALVQKLPEAIADPVKAGPALTDLKNALKDYQAGLTLEASKSADGQLRTAIHADAAAIARATAQVEAAGDDVNKALTALNAPEFQKLGEGVKALCDK